MKKKTKIAVCSGVILLITGLSNNVFSEQQCQGDDYNFLNGHRSVFPEDYLPSNIAENVKICVNNDVPPYWNSATQYAIDMLNSQLSGISTSLRFSYETGNDCTFFVEMSYDLPSNLYARINEPVMPGYTAVQIDGNNETWLGFFFMGHIMIHELLHTIGLGHTGIDVWHEIPNTDGYYDTLYAGRSIMCNRADEDDFPQRYLNFLDKRALETMYP